jgi:lactoylglutathione lyase
MKLILAAALVATFCVSAYAVDEVIEGEIAKWQGKWKPVSIEHDGKPTSAEKLKVIGLTVEGSKYHFHNGDLNEHGAYEFHPYQAPKALDIVVGDGVDKGKIYLVIYKIEGDRLTICLQNDNKKRPKEFTSAEGTGCVVEQWERVKPKSDFSRGTIDLGVVTSDVDQAVKFYTEAIGFKETQGFSVDGKLCADAGLTDQKSLDIRVLVLEDNPSATRLKLMSLPGVKSQTSDNSFIHSQLGFSYMTIYVTDGDAALDRLKRAGVKPLSKGPVKLPDALGANMTLSVVRDPDGNLIELIGPTSKN